MFSPKYQFLFFPATSDNWFRDHQSVKHQMYLNEVNCTKQNIIQTADGYWQFLRNPISFDNEETISGLVS